VDQLTSKQFQQHHTRLTNLRMAGNFQRGVSDPEVDRIKNFKNWFKVNLSAKLPVSL
jgi:hypothetical protein